MGYKINELVALTGLSDNTIRRLEEIGYLRPERNSNNNYRYYTNTDVSKVMLVQTLRKMGFSHSEIKDLLEDSIEGNLSAYHKKIEELDTSIKNLNAKKHLLNDYVRIIESHNNIDNKPFYRLSVSLACTYYEKDNVIFNEPERLNLLHKYIYNAPESHIIYCFREKDIKDNVFRYESGWAIKPFLFPTLDSSYNDEFIMKSPYVELVPKRPVLVYYVNLPMNFEESLGPNFTTYKESFLKAAYDYCDEHNMKINGDIIALRIIVAADEKHDTQTLLLNVPVGNL